MNVFEQKGRDLRTVLIDGECLPTDLFRTFAALIEEHLALHVRFAEDCGDTLWIYLDSEDYAALQSYPIADIGTCISKACAIQRHPPVLAIAAEICDFSDVARRLYMSLHIKEMNSRVRRSVADGDFILTETADPAHIYAIVYDTPRARASGGKNGKTDTITAFVHAYLRTNDPLGLFAGGRFLPVVTDCRTFRGW